MNTTRNRSKVMAVVLRAARTDILRSVEFMLPEKVAAFSNALESIDVVAEELEALADERLMCSASLGRKGRCPNVATKVYGYDRTAAGGGIGELPRCDQHPLGNHTHVRVIAAAPDPDGGADGR